MPITCPIKFKPLSADTFRSLDYAVMAQAFASHQGLGSLADELVYQSDFAARLDVAGFNVLREVPVAASFGSFSKPYSLDMVIDEMAVYELKTVAKLLSEHSAQLLNYLLLLDLERGKLINFRPMSIESRFVNAPLSGADRRRFSIDSRCWQGPAVLFDLVIQLLRDWGTGLGLSLYHQALVHLLGGEQHVSVLLPMHRDGIELANQRFHLASPGAAFRLTAFEQVPSGYSSQLSRLLHASPLKAIHWINIAYHTITFTTIGCR
jgi:GxxExxY protein